MKIFEELPVWQRARALVRDVYRATAGIRDPGFLDPIRRAAVSVPSHIAEGHERGTSPDLIPFLFFAKGSAGEVRCQLYLAEDLGCLNADTVRALRGACVDISRQISAWIKSMQTLSFNAGPAYHKELDRAVERLASRFGYERQSNGSYRKVREPRALYWNGRRKRRER